MSVYLQRSFALGGRKRGCHLVTDEVKRAITDDLKQIHIGLCVLFIQHTSASLTVNENYDSDVPKDFEDQLNRMVREDERWRHDAEGPDDMPAHVKSSLMGSSLTIPITNGALNLGTWQGIWLCEHRNQGSARRIVATLHGAPKK